jgi:hypothetical protein
MLPFIPTGSGIPNYFIPLHTNPKVKYRIGIPGSVYHRTPTTLATRGDLGSLGSPKLSGPILAEDVTSARVIQTCTQSIQTFAF